LSIVSEIYFPRDRPPMSRVSGLTWIQSEPPRGSGWVRSLFKQVDFVPTRYRVVVLTVSKYQKWDRGVSFVKSQHELTRAIPNRSDWHKL